MTASTNASGLATFANLSYNVAESITLTFAATGLTGATSNTVAVSSAAAQSIAVNAEYVGLYGRLIDRFGDNGLVSVVLGRRDGRQLHIDLWLMSCRVLKRDMELAMLDRLVEEARRFRIEAIIGVYIPSKKNSMVADLYDRLGFARESQSVDGNVHYRLELANYTPQNTHINILETSAAHG